MATETSLPTAPEPPTESDGGGPYLLTGEGWPYLLTPFIPVAVVLKLSHAGATWLFLASALGSSRLRR
jgi:hypothetical protein